MPPRMPEHRADLKLFSLPFLSRKGSRRRREAPLAAPRMQALQPHALPAVSAPAGDEEGDAEDPVGEHGHPDAEDAVAEVAGQEDAEADAHGPHGDGGDEHGESGVACGAQGLGEDEGDGPD